MFFSKKKTLKDNEIILSQNVALSMDGRATRRNNNTFIVGDKHTIRTFPFCLPNLMQMNGSYVVIDHEGLLRESTEQMFRENGYDIKVLDVAHPEKSNHYNPFQYMREDYDVINFVDVLVNNFNNASKNAFLEKYRKALMASVVFYLYKECRPKERTFSNIKKVLDCAVVEPDNDYYKSPLDIIFEDLKKEDPNHIAVMQYSIFKELPTEEALKVVIECQISLALFNLPDYSQLTDTDDLDIGSIGLKPTVLYVSPTIFSSVYNSSILPVLFTQLFDTLHHTAETKCESHKLPVHVRVMFNQFGEYGVIPDLPICFATMRKYNISCAIQVPMDRVRSMYPGDWKGIIGCCDSIVYPFYNADVLQNDAQLLDYFIEPPSKKFHKPSLKGCPASVSGSVKFLNSKDDFLSLEPDQCVVSIRGCFPIVDSVYDCKTHPNYKYIQISEE